MATAVRLLVERKKWKEFPVIARLVIMKCVASTTHKSISFSSVCRFLILMQQQQQQQLVTFWSQAPNVREM